MQANNPRVAFQVEAAPPCYEAISSWKERRKAKTDAAYGPVNTSK